MNVSKVHMIRRVVAAVLVVTMLFGILSGKIDMIFADEVKTGMIDSASGSLAQTYKEPSTSASTARKFKFGKTVKILDDITDEKGQLWYLLEYTLDSTGATETSYCLAENVDIDNVFAYGTVNTNELALRNYAGTSDSTILIKLDKGTQVELLNQTTVSSNTWYRVRYTSSEGTVYLGWMYGSYITLDRYNVEVDPAYIEELKAKGFPESYTYKLAVLHALYPEWIFEPVKTGLDWATVIKSETLKADGSSNPINMVSTSSDDAMKSVHEDDYDWETNTWTIRDGDSWVAVHPEYLAYIMDPRNFLDETYIFQFESLSYSESHTIEGVKAVIGSSFMADDAVDSDGSMFNYATAFMSIGKEVGVSPYHLVSRVKQEQGSKGTSSLISGTYKGYEGYYNYFNFGAHGVTNTAVIVAGLKYAKNQGWNTRYKSLLGGSQMIAKNYIARGQDTLYFQKFNVVWADMLYGHQYMGAVLAPSSEARSIAKAYTDKHQAFVFRIPVYENMPKEAVQFNTTGNRNNYLKDLTVAGLSLTPTFSGATTEYSLIVGEAVSSINISATPVVKEAEVSGTGAYNLKVGTNTIKILCESESGDVRTYTLTIVREGAEEPEVPDTNEPSSSETESGTGEPGTSEPGTSEPEISEPETGEPGTSEPGTSEPGTSEPGTSEPESSEPTESEPDTPTEPEIPAGISSDKYTIATYITGVEPETKASDFLAGFTLTGGATVKLFTSKGEENTSVVTTGSVLSVYDGETLIASYEIVIYGDVSGDGKITILDIMKINRHTLKIASLSGCYLSAGDVNKNGDVNILDIMITNRHTLGLATIKQ